MLFNSVSFLCFLVVAVSSFALAPIKWRIPLVCAFSVGFYSTWRWEFIILLVLSTSVDYWAAAAIARLDNPGRRLAVLVAALTVNLGLLIGFKYTQMLVDSAQGLMALAGLPGKTGAESASLGIILPLGISFYTFHSISYTVDVYRNHVKPIRNYTIFFAYVTFWPQLIAGPILRATEVVPQLENPRRPSRAMLVSGVERVVVGLFKKVVLADPLSGLVDKMFVTDPTAIATMPASEVMLAAFLFGFQIYLDFSAYSDIAIGSARMMGIRFPENFNWPYLARNPREFWQRWHISLSSWIRDYLYLPLTARVGGGRSVGGISIEDDGRGRRVGALVLTWFIMGLWHGANWTFALWGLYHAAVLIAYRGLHRSLGGRLGSGRLFDALSWSATLPVMMLGWLFFRCETVEPAGRMALRLVSLDAYASITTHRGSYFAVAGLLVAGMLAIKALQETRIISAPERRTWMATATYMGAYAVMMVAVVIFLQPVNQFIYFQF